MVCLVLDSRLCRITRRTHYVDCSNRARPPAYLHCSCRAHLVSEPGRDFAHTDRYVPDINIPVIAVAWQYTGMNPEEPEGRLTSTYERVLTTTVDNSEHLESTTVNGQAFVRI
jgi:hypothetical protein